MFEARIQVCCPHCQRTNIKKNGRQTELPVPELRQTVSRHVHLGADPRIRQQVINMTLFASGIKDIAAVLKLSPVSVMEKLRRHGCKIKEPDFQGHFEAEEVDEFWSFVDRRKSRKRWCWYAWARQERKILAFRLGKRNQGACRALFQKLKASR